MSTYLIEPSDVLFFRDGRPMSGSLCGYGAAWPSPHTLSAAWHAALHRAEFADIAPHTHRRVAGRDAHTGERIVETDRQGSGYRFGALAHCGAFPVGPDAGSWYFPRPLDALSADTMAPSAAPSTEVCAASCSLPKPLRYAVASQRPPSKEKAGGWLSANGFAAYAQAMGGNPAADARADAAIFDAEMSIGIGIDDTHGVQDGERFYSAQYLRLKPGWRMGSIVQCPDKGIGGEDLVARLIDDERHIIVGGQQRVCTVERVRLSALPLPEGQRDHFPVAQIDGSDCHLVKFVLLTPALFPQIAACAERAIHAHPGGWLPSWIEPDSGRVLLRDSTDVQRAAGESRAAYRARVRAAGGIDAQLVAALTGKPIPVTGWSLADPRAARQAGTRSTQLAVPSGSVYYFAARSAADARALAAALNWHGAAPASEATTLQRRSAIAGEKGFGIGLCCGWQFAQPRSA